MFDPAEGGTVSFRRTSEDEAWHRRAEAEGMVGHPPNVEWFCADHLPRARELANLPVDEAISQWHSEISNGDAETRLPDDPESRPCKISVELATPPTAVIELSNQLAAQIDGLLAILGEDAPTGLNLEFQEDRTWTPMDRVGPPNCPYQLRRTAEVERGGWQVTIRTVMAYWNQRELADASLLASLHGPTARLLVVGNSKSAQLQSLKASARGVDIGEDELRAAVGAILELP